MQEKLETLLHRWKQGDLAAGEEVIAVVYPELRRLAAHYFRRETPGHTLQPTALVNELFVKLFSGSHADWQDRSHFFAVAARQMRLILIDHARRKSTLKRDTAINISFVKLSPGPENILTIDKALRDLERLDSRAAQVVELRVFGGLIDREIAEVLDISTATVKRDWTFAKAWLLARLSE